MTVHLVEPLDDADVGLVARAVTAFVVSDWKRSMRHGFEALPESSTGQRSRSRPEASIDPRGR